MSTSLWFRSLWIATCARLGDRRKRRDSFAEVICSAICEEDEMSQCAVKWKSTRLPTYNVEAPRFDGKWEHWHLSLISIISYDWQVEGQLLEKLHLSSTGAGPEASSLADTLSSHSWVWTSVVGENQLGGVVLTHTVVFAAWPEIRQRGRPGTGFYWYVL